jgi:hypothetical protein
MGFRFSIEHANWLAHILQPTAVVDQPLEKLRLHRAGTRTSLNVVTIDRARNSIRCRLFAERIPGPDLNQLRAMNSCSDLVAESGLKKQPFDLTDPPSDPVDSVREFTLARRKLGSISITWGERETLAADSELDLATIGRYNPSRQ